MKYTFLAILLIVSGWVQSAIRPADGLWRSTDDPDIGSGMMMITQGGITLATVFTYTGEGKPRWYLAVGSVDENGRFVADLKETINGTSILVDDPTSAVFAAESRQLTIDFYGSQTASFQIDEQPIKTMQSYAFGFGSWQTEHLTLTDGTSYQVADLSGTWAVGGLNTEDSFILNLVEFDANTGNPGVFLEKAYVSNHPSTDGWTLRCPWQFIPNTLPFSQPFCTLDRSQAEMPLLKVSFADLGVNKISLVTEDSEQSFMGIRTVDSGQFQPHDGYWRPEDDPDIGGGLVMATQGAVTIVLMYTYDEQGQASWSIAAGVFDEHGLFQAQLRTTTGGSPIGIDGKTSATYTNEIQNLSIQLLGNELATFSVDGTTAKHIQNVNFGSEVYSTEAKLVNGKNFLFPGLKGRWLIVDDSRTTTSVLHLSDYNPNCCQSPPDPLYLDSSGYSNTGTNNILPFNPDFSIRINCVRKFVPYSTFNYPDFEYCYGANSRDDENNLIKVYFEDIGLSSFKYYVGTGVGNYDYGAVEEINRGSGHYRLYRLDSD